MSKVIIRVIGDRSQVVLQPPSASSTRLTVFADGVKGVGARPGHDISNYFRERGDFLNASYPALGEFSTEKARADLAIFCEPYDEIDLVGASWGGQVLYACGLACMQYHPGKTVTLTVADSPFERRDVMAGEGDSSRICQAGRGCRVHSTNA